MTKKTESLSFPSNALAMMRELQDLDAPSIETQTKPPEERDLATTLPDTHATSSEVGSVPSLAVRSRGSSEVAKLSVEKRTRQGTTQAEANPLAGAVKELLSRPYASDAGNGPHVVSTVKIPGEVWERLDWAAKLTGQAKQDIIRDALKDYFRKLVKEL